jgi:hypothetical protein
MKTTLKGIKTKIEAYFNVEGKVLKLYNTVSVVDPLTGELLAEVTDAVIPPNANIVFPISITDWNEHPDKPKIELANAGLVKAMKSALKAELLANIAANKDW